MFEDVVEIGEEVEEMEVVQGIPPPLSAWIEEKNEGIDQRIKQIHDQAIGLKREIDEMVSVHPISLPPLLALEDRLQGQDSSIFIIYCIGVTFYCCSILHSI